MPPYLTILYMLFPFMRWLKRYPKRWLRHDFFAGVTLSFIVLPQAIAFSLVAGLPVAYGVYAAMIPPIIAGLYGTSSHLIIGPTNATAIVVTSILAPLMVVGHPPEVVLLLGLMVGLFQLILGVFRMGFIMDFISRSVLLGFTAGAALSIGLKQIKYALGVNIDDTGLFYQTLFNALMNLDHANLYAVSMALATVLMMYWLGKSFKRLPAGLIALVVVTGISFAFDLPSKGLATVGLIQAEFPSVAWPIFTLGLVQELVVPALALALLGLIASTSISRGIALKSHQILENNQEFVGQGLANIGASLLHAMPVAGSFSLSNTSWHLGAKSSLTCVFMGLGMFLVVKIFAPATPYLPLAAIAGMLFMVVPKMVSLTDIKAAMFATRGDAAVVLVTFTATLFLRLEFAVYAGILLSIFLYLAKTSHPQLMQMLPVKPGHRMQKDQEDIPCLQMGIVKIEGSLFFGSAEYTKNHLMLYLDNHPDMKHLVLRLEGIEVLDASGIVTLREINEKLLARGGRLALAGCAATHTEILANSGFLGAVGSDYIRRSTKDAIKQLMENFNYVKCHQCPHAHFRECKAYKKEGKKQQELEKNAT